MRIELEFEQEEDGRWIAEAPAWPGVMAYGSSREDAARRVQALVLRVLADKLENGEILKGEEVSAYDNLTEEQKREVDSIFNDEEFLACMERGLRNDGESTDQNLASARVDEAIEAFSANPPEFWAMLHKRDMR